jgi:hypothetical protein
MIRIGFIAVLQLLMLAAPAQKATLQELTELLDVPASRLDNILLKRGFRKDVFLSSNEHASLSFRRVNKEGTLIQYYWLDPERKGVYETTSADEFAAIKTEIKTAGFSAPKDDSTNKQSLVYQKQVITIETGTRVDDSTVFYVLRASKKDLPRKKDMIYAEDLLYLDSHEYLVEMFGRDNVTPNHFYYSENDSSRCSVVFPKTSREAIVVWKDEVNMRRIAFIIVGGNLRSAANDIASTQSFSMWRSRQGPYCGMTLRELEMLNKEPVRFFNWNTESAGCLVPKNKGEVDFDRLGIVLNCMNCSFIKVSQTNIIDSQTAIDEMQKVFVTSLIIVPEKNK